MPTSFEPIIPSWSWPTSPATGRGAAGEAQGLRHAHPGRGRPDLHHRYARRPGQDGDPTADIASGMDLPRPSSPRCSGAAAPARCDHRGLDVRGHRRMDGACALHPDAHRGPAGPDGPQPRSIAPYDAYPTSDGESSSASRTTAAGVRWSPTCSRPRSLPTTPASPPTSHGWRTAPSVTPRSSPHPALDHRAAGRATGRGGIPAAQIKTLAHVVDREQLRARDRWRSVELEHLTIEALLPPATFGDVEAAMGPVPALGQHTHALLVEAGLDHGAGGRRHRRGIAYQPDRRSPSVPTEATPLPEVSICSRR